MRVERSVRATEGVQMSSGTELQGVCSNRLNEIETKSARWPRIAVDMNDGKAREELKYTRADNGLLLKSPRSRLSVPGLYGREDSEEFKS